MDLMMMELELYNLWMLLNILNKSGYKPKRTIRVVLFMNEENGLRGASKYAEISKKNSLNHIFALESDAGGFTVQEDFHLHRTMKILRK
jgi:Zn-dependent M28 family amino/carboxypeptidase